MQRKNTYPGDNTANRKFYLSQQMYLHMRNYGYEFIDLPIIEPAELFLVKAGDQIVNKLFTFEHRGSELALRPEFTASAAYHYANQHPENAPINRWQFSGYIFKDDPFDVESNRQQFSVGAEIFGLSGVLADAEIIGMAALGLLKQNISSLKIVLGHIGLLRSVLARFQLDYRTEHFLLSHLQDLKNPSRGRNFVVEQIEKLFLYLPIAGKLPNTQTESEIQPIFDLMLETTGNDLIMGGRTRQDISLRLYQKYRRSLERSQIIATIDFLVEWGQIIGTPDEAFSAIQALIPPDDLVSHEILTDWKTLIDLLGIYGVTTNQINIQPSLVRSWDYYSGILFELRTLSGVHLGGGGRYDELGKLLGGKQRVPAVGFAYYIDELIKVGSVDKEVQPQRLVVIASPESEQGAVRWANQLRQSDFDVQILPEYAPDLPTYGYLLAQADATVRYRDQSYTFDNFDILINELKRIES
ncbi:MAG: ATP phosphoribosyltransferase regulatory subunit [Chloroflexota bacterium]